MSHPVDDLHHYEFVVTADWTATQLDRIGFAHSKLSPGDGTSYDISMIRPPTMTEFHFCLRNPERLPTFGDHYYMAHSFGPLYEWTGEIGDWTYVHEKWTQRRGGTDEWTARVLFRFLNTLHSVIERRKEEAA